MVVMVALAEQVNVDEDTGSNFLGVTKSVRGLQWRERLAVPQRKTATAIAQRHDLPELLGRILAARDVALDGVETFLDPTIRRLMPDPSTVRDMDKAAGRIADAIERREKIALGLRI